MSAASLNWPNFMRARANLTRVCVCWIVSANPDNYTAHANLALALFEMKRFSDAIPEYEWLAAAKPDIAATYFFLGIAHDNLGQYQQALDAYQKFLTRADPVKSKLEIEK